MKLFEPGKIGKVQVKNRLVLTPMSINLEHDGFTTEAMIRFFEERAKGGVGLIIVGDGTIDYPIGNNVKESIAIDDDKYIPMLKEMTRRVKGHGAKICLQLSHGGRRAGRVAKSGYLEVTRGRVPVAPSALAHPVPGYVVPRELSLEEIEDIIVKFGQAARRTVEAGFDFIGLHCAHMYLLGEFLSPWANKRQDKYGGDLERRLTFPLQVLSRIKREVGDDCPIIPRMNLEEPEGGNSFEDIKRIARRLQEGGADAIFISVGFGAVSKESYFPSVTAMRDPDAYLMPLVEQIKPVVSVPLIAVNKIRNARIAEEILQAGKADFIAMGRPLVADPELPNKSAAGRLDDVVPCIFCNRCQQNVLIDFPCYCSVNPVSCRETEMPIRPASTKKDVVIIGGGPAGMQAAIVAASRGHKVAIYEKGDKLGGQLLLAAKPPGKAIISTLVDYFAGQVKKRKVSVELGSEITAEAIAGRKPDVVIIAAGGTPIVPQIPGIDGKNVVTAWQVLGGAGVGQKVAIIGGGQVGAETAEYLAEQGKSVTLVEMLSEIAIGLSPIERVPLLFSLEKLGVSILTKATAERVTGNKLVVNHVGEQKQLPADTVVLAAGLKPNQEIANKLKGRVPELYIIGDCSEPGRLMEAVRQGFEVGNKI